MAVVSIIIPTTGRLERIANCIREFARTTPGHDVEIIIVCDGDHESYERLQQEDCKVLYQEKSNAINAWNLGLKYASGEYIVFGANDLRPQNGWLDEALRVMGSLPDGGGLVGLNTEDHDGDTLSTHFMASRWFIKEHMGGVLAIPHYHHCFTDNEVNERAKRAGRFVYAENAKLIHDHPSRGRRDMDECDTYSAHWFLVDCAMYELRKQQNFPDDFEPVI